MVASLLYFGHALETSRQSEARSVYFRRRLRGAALLGAAPHPLYDPGYYPGFLYIDSSFGSYDSSRVNFINCDTGILIKNFTLSEVDILNNHFYPVALNDSLQIHILVDSFRNTTNLDTTEINKEGYVGLIIEQNQMLGGYKGIGLNIDSANVVIYSNQINFTGSHSTQRTGIEISDNLLSSLQYGDYVTNNTLDSVHYGIVLSTRYHPNIIENTITLVPSGSGDTVKGISLYNCPGGGLGCNTITGYDASTEVSGYGISCDSSTGTVMLDNQLSNLGVDIMNFHQQKLQLIDNILGNSAVGIGISDTGAFIGNQGTDTFRISGSDTIREDTTYDNQWTGTYAVANIKSYKVAENPTIDIFFVLSSATFNPNLGFITEIRPANPVTATVITPTGEYGAPGTGSDCTPPANLQLRMPWTGNNSSQTNADTSKTQISTLDYKLIPNLFRDNFSATITMGTNESGEVDIYDLNGILIGRYAVGSGINNLNLSNPELVGGVYIYKVFVNGQIKTTDKLVVVH